MPVTPKKPEPPDTEWMFILISIAMLAVLLAVNLAHADNPPRVPPADTPPRPVEPEVQEVPVDVPAAEVDAPVRRVVEEPLRTVEDRVVIKKAKEPPKDEDLEDGEPKLSLPTEADRQSWKRPGFRLGLSAAYGQLYGLRGAPDGALYAANLRAGLRLDATWSIMSSFQYALARESGGLSGLRFAGTIDPTLHVTPSFSIAVGFGFGGIVEGTTSRKDAMPLPSQIETSYTFPDASTPLAKCSGVGAAALARAEWMYVIGPRMAGTVAFEVVGQWTGCEDDTGRVEPDTGKAIVRRQWWPHTGATFSVGFAWR